MTTSRPECFQCVHFLDIPRDVEARARCHAYPDGIPQDIFFEAVPHRIPRGDEEGGQVFSPKDEAAAKETGVPMAKEPTKKTEERQFRRLPSI